MSASTSTSTSSSPRHDAVVLAGGAEKPRDLPIPGRDLDGIHFAMEFLPQQNRRGSATSRSATSCRSSPDGKHVVVIGGGDTGSDCIGTSNRQGALSVTQLEILPRPPEKENKPLDLAGLAAEAAHLVEPGGRRRARLLRADREVHRRRRRARVKLLHCVRVDDKMKPIAGTEFALKADLVLLAMGFLGPVQEGMIEQLGVELDKRGNVLADTKSYRTSLDKVFACGDMRRGQSLVVWAIREGRQAARAVDEYLMGTSDLPR